MPAIKTKVWIISAVAIVLSAAVTVSILHPEPLQRAYNSIKNQTLETAHATAHATAELVLPSISEDARNNTLGFQKVYYISLPKRTDRQDAMTLMSDMLNIDSTYVPGVDGSSVPSEERVIGSKLGDGQYGCWRSHANIWRKMIQDNIATALILEDDVDFDIDIKDQLFRISEGIQSGPNLIDNNSTKPIISSAPYGTAWDLFFVGFCAHTSPESAGPTNTPHITVHDPSLLDQPRMDSHMRAEFDKFGIQSNQTRLLVPLHSYYCTQGYGVSIEGAKRLLYSMGYKDVTAPVDNVMSWTTTGGGLRGIAPIPALISQFKVGHGADSNIQGGTEHEIHGEVNKEKGHGGRFRNSARKAMHDWVQWVPRPDDSNKER